MYEATLLLVLVIRWAPLPCKEKGCTKVQNVFLLGYFGWDEPRNFESEMFLHQRVPDTLVLSDEEIMPEPSGGQVVVKTGLFI